MGEAGGLNTRSIDCTAGVNSGPSGSLLKGSCSSVAGGRHLSFIESDIFEFEFGLTTYEPDSGKNFHLFEEMVILMSTVKTRLSILGSGI
jgi:hypothetical protein